MNSGTCVLAVGDDELEGETTRTRCRRLPRDGHTWEDSGRPHGWSWTRYVIAASRLRASERAQVHSWTASAMNFNICICYCYICILLKKTNSMIYYMLYKIRRDQREMWKHMCSLLGTMSLVWRRRRRVVRGCHRRGKAWGTKELT